MMICVTKRLEGETVDFLVVKNTPIKNRQVE